MPKQRKEEQVTEHLTFLCEALHKMAHVCIEFLHCAQVDVEKSMGQSMALNL